MTRSACTVTHFQSSRKPERMELTPIRLVHSVGVQPEHSPAAAGALFIHQALPLSEEVPQPELLPPLPERRAK